MNSLTSQWYNKIYLAARIHRLDDYKKQEKKPQCEEKLRRNSKPAVYLVDSGFVTRLALGARWVQGITSIAKLHHFQSSWLDRGHIVQFPSGQYITLMWRAPERRFTQVLSLRAGQCALMCSRHYVSAIGAAGFTFHLWSPFSPWRGAGGRIQIGLRHPHRCRGGAV